MIQRICVIPSIQQAKELFFNLFKFFLRELYYSGLNVLPHSVILGWQLSGVILLLWLPLNPVEVWCIFNS